MRKEVKRIRVLVIRKLVRSVGRLKSKKLVPGSQSAVSNNVKICSLFIKWEGWVCAQHVSFCVAVMGWERMSCVSMPYTAFNHCSLRDRMVSSMFKESSPFLFVNEITISVLCVFSVTRNKWFQGVSKSRMSTLNQLWFYFISLSLA